MGDEGLRTDRYRTTFHAATAGLLVLDGAGAPVEANAAFLALLAAPGDTIDRVTLRDRVHPDDRELVRRAMDDARAGARRPVTVDARIAAADGEEVHVEMVAVRLTDEPDPGGEVLVQIVDVTERHRREAALRAEADHDPLTALQNRRSFERALVTHLGVSARYGTAGALLLADVDRFKQVNDTHGHVVGDEVLREVGRILRSRLRGSDVVGRLGGDEFAVLLPLASRSGAEAVAASIVAAVRARGASDPPPGWPVTMSVGASMITGGQPTAADALRQADRALYAAKQGGRDRWVLHDGG